MAETGCTTVWLLENVYYSSASFQTIQAAAITRRAESDQSQNRGARKDIVSLHGCRRDRSRQQEYHPGIPIRVLHQKKERAKQWQSEPLLRWEVQHLKQPVVRESRVVGIASVTRIVGPFSNGIPHQYISA